MHYRARHQPDNIFLELRTQRESSEYTYYGSLGTLTLLVTSLRSWTFGQSLQVRNLKRVTEPEWTSKSLPTLYILYLTASPFMVLRALLNALRTNLALPKTNLRLLLRHLARIPSRVTLLLFHHALNPAIYSRTYTFTPVLAPTNVLQPTPRQLPLPPRAESANQGNAPVSTAGGRGGIAR